MRILILSQFFQPEPIFKGLPFAKALAERGHDVEVLTGFPNYPGGKIYPGYRIRLWQREQIDGINVIRMPLFPSHDTSGWRRMVTYLTFAFSCLVLGTFLVKRPQVIYIYNLITLHFVARIFRFLFWSRTVLDVQDLWPESVTNSGMMKRSKLHSVLQWWSDVEYRRADRLIALSTGFRDNLVARGIPSDRVSVIYNWCDETAMQSTRTNESLPDRAADHFVITFAGTIGVMQSLDVMIAAARQLVDLEPQVTFQIVGGGIDVDRLKELAQNLTNVRFVGRVPPTEIGQYFDHSDVLLVHLKDLPLFRITIPSKIQAYMFAAKPILNGVNGDAARLIEESGAGVNFEPENAESLVAHVRYLKKLAPAARQAMGNAGRKFYEQELSSKVGFDRLSQVLESCGKR